MLLVVTKSGKNILVEEIDPREADQRKRILQDFADHMVQISDCEYIGKSDERSSSICNCPNDCHGGRTEVIAEIILVDTESYAALENMAQMADSGAIIR